MRGGRRHLESLFRVLLVDIREFYLQPVALCLSPSLPPPAPYQPLASPSLLSCSRFRRAPPTESTCKCIQYFKISSWSSSSLRHLFVIGPRHQIAIACATP